jgi:(R,R)-butanediol dehydrogenase / meso-butanediol dehydrogenase / diacetyl reductase
MRAAVLYSAGDLRIVERPVPEPGRGELLLRVETVGICGTDAAEYDHGPSLFPMLEPHPVTGHRGPLTPGHELGGRVAALGDGVGGFAIGDLVASSGSTGCGTCDRCLSGRPSRCSEYWAVGLNRDGALAEYCTVPASACRTVDDTILSPDAAALAQPMSIAVHALRQGRVQSGEPVLVIGAGGVGAFVTYAAATAGCEVITTDLDPDRLDIARSLGAARTVLTGVDDTGPIDAEVVFEMTGSESGLRRALDSVASGGRLVVVGFQHQLVEADFANLTRREQQWIGSNGIDTAEDLPEAIRLLASRAEPWADVAPEVIPLESVGSALADMTRGRRGPIKTLVSPALTEPRPSRI